MTRLLVSCGVAETRAVLLKQDGPWSLWVGPARGDEDAAPPTYGDIVFGRVTAQASEFGGVFVDIAASKDAFLPVRTGAPPPPNGAGLVVQVKKDAYADKGAVVSATPTVVNAYVAATPGGHGVSWSPRGRGKPKSVSENLGAELLADRNFKASIVWRTAASGRPEAALLAALDAALADWRAIDDSAANAARPGRLGPAPDAVIAAIEAHSDWPLDDVVIDDVDAVQAATRFFETRRPDIAARLSVHTDKTPLLTANGADDAEAEALDANVALSNGGRVIVEPTAAFVAIDVDAGAAPGRRDKSGMAAQVNAAALDAIARQISLRNLAGQIVVDFIETTPAERRKLERALERLQKSDRRIARAALVDEGGLALIVRERRGPTILDQLTQTASDGNPTRRFTLDARAKAAIADLETLLASQRAARATLTARPEIATYIHKRPQWSDRLAARYGARFRIEDADLPGKDFDVVTA